MQKSRYKPSRKSSGPVKVALAVTKFNDVLSGNSAVTQYVMRLTRKNDRVRLENDNLYIRPPGATIQFTLSAATGEKENYYPLGISYVREGQKNGGDSLKLGFLNFPQSKLRLDKRTITVTDSYRDKEKKIRYKFSIFVQRGSDGKIGIIDPGMIHENTGFH